MLALGQLMADEGGHSVGVADEQEAMPVVERGSHPREDVLAAQQVEANPQRLDEPDRGGKREVADVEPNSTISISLARGTYQTSGAFRQSLA
ncbi:MAG: hypothetical protein FJ278_20615 [Planctomycetes bacterium]|nr:hypothetical protein [Planctomycetota bacterium]